MSRIARLFEDLKRDGRKGMIAYLTAGDPTPERTPALVEALAAARQLSRTEGILPALESSHAVAEAIRRAPGARDKIFVVNLSGRGDKDIDIYRENFPELDAQ